MRKLFILALLGLLVIAGCREGPSPTPATAVPATITAAAPSPAPLETPTAQTVTPEPAETPVVEDGTPPIYLAIIWHQHQPVYFKDPATGIYAKPWVRVHAAKDYVDMATTLAQYPDVKATFNLTPSLLRQLEDLAAGATDLYWVYSEVPAAELSEEQKQFILERFFDTNRKVIARFPRYQELLTKRDSSSDPLSDYETQDYLDLQILFNLAWTDPDWLAEEPLASLVAKERNYAEADKEIIFSEHLRLIQEVIPVHRQLQDAGQIEVTMTPFAHPILPLLVNTNLARVAMPDADLPPQFAFGQDAVAQVELGIELYEEHFGRRPTGMWPAEGSVAQEIVTMVAQAGIKWMASDEGVLARSLGMNSFTRDSAEVVNEADVLYRPYYVQGRRGGPLAIVFRDVVISDKVGFTYSGMPGELAAEDFINRIQAIRDKLRESGAQGPHLVSVILDGENAWEHYDNDGKEFLHTLYQLLSEDPHIITVTPTEFLEIAPDQPAIDELWAGSWINHDFGTWIGEEEENRAWEYLLATREMLQRYETGARQASPEAIEEAKILMYIAEGSDWFWWYGDDQDSGDDESFDRQFRDTLKQIYLTLGEEPPAFVDVPIIPQRPVLADQPSTGLIEPTIDGVVSEGEWDAAAVYQAHGGVLVGEQPVFSNMAYGFDQSHFYLNVNSAAPWASLGEAGGENSLQIYLAVPGGGPANNFSLNGSLLGFPANRVVQVRLQNGQIVDATISPAASSESWATEGLALSEVEGMPIEMVAAGEDSLELGIPLELLGNADTGDRISLRLIYSQVMTVGNRLALVDAAQLPGPGPAVLAVPDLGTTIIVLDIDDPQRDDHGPGTYTYPTDEVFRGGSYDILNFQVGYDEENIVFRFTMRGPVENPWGSPNGLAIHTFDIYIDTDGDGQGGTTMLPGRNLAFQEGYAWDYAIHAEGWTPAIYVPAAGGSIEQIAGPTAFFILADPGQQKVTIRVPKSILGDNPEDWQYAAVVLSQEGFPSSGVLRARDVLPTAEQWRVGGGPAGTTNHTRVMDLVWPVAGEQEAWLSDFTPTDRPQPQLTAGDFARVPMLGTTNDQ